MTRLAVASIAFLVIFTVFTTVYAATAEKAEVRLLPKWVWVILCLFVPFFGGLLYLMVGRPLGRGSTGTGRSRVIAPDDDPNFLREVQRKMRKKDEDNK
jgi:hypothetical protein